MRDNLVVHSSNSDSIENKIYTIREKQVFFRVTDNEADRIEQLANYLEISKSTMLRNLALSSLEDAELFKKMGILKLAKGIKKTSEAVVALKEIRNQATKT